MSKWDESKHPRGKTTGESTPGSFAPSMSTIRRRVAGKISRMSPEDAMKLAAEIAATPGYPKIDIPVIRRITGGYASQSINALVSQHLRAVIYKKGKK